MRIINLNPGSGIGASCWFLELDGHAVLLDAGVHPKHEGLESLPDFERIKDEDVAAIALSHCHHDHVGSLPVALRYFPNSHVLMTELSYFIIERVLHNSVNVMIRQKEEFGIAEYPLYSHREVDEIAHIFQGYRYNREIEWAFQSAQAKGTESPTLEFYDAGHALGAAGMMARGKRQTVFYTGDVCFDDQTLLKGARFEDVSCDVLIMETTRGNRPDQPEITRESEIQRFKACMQETLSHRGCVLIPTFALGRTQEILAILALLMKTGEMKSQPIYIGGLGRVFTEIYDLQAHRAHRNHTGLLLNEALNLIVLDKFQAQKMKLTGGRIFVMTAGMMTENTTAHDLAARMIEEERHSIYFVGYADPETPGGRLKKSRPGETFFFSQQAGELARRCRLEDFDLTAHANRRELLEFVGRAAPETVLLGHGEPDSRNWFEREIRKAYPKTNVIQPPCGEAVEV